MALKRHNLDIDTLAITNGFNRTGAMDGTFNNGGRTSTLNSPSRLKVGGSRIKVAVRCRPLLENELLQGQTSTCLNIHENSNKIR